MITIIYGGVGMGKTCFLAHTLNRFAFDKERNTLMRREIESLNSIGFNLTVPKHCVSANFPLEFRKFGYTRRNSRLINPFHLGFKNEDVKTHFNFPYEVIGITEAQTYFNSRMSLYYPDWQSRFFEEHRHNNLDFYLDCQRSHLIDLNIRELSTFIEIVRLDIKNNEFGSPCKLTWTLRIIENNFLNEKYLNSGKTDKSCYTEQKVVADYNVFSLYDSQLMKPKFYDGRYFKDFDYKQSCITERSLDGFKEFCKSIDGAVPQGFYKKRTAKTDKN